MPEGPEVETVRQMLLPHIIGVQINSLDIRLPRLISFHVPLSQSFPQDDDKPFDWKNLPSPSASPDLLQTLSGQALLNLTRKGKYLIFIFNPSEIVVHLGMTGSLTWVPDPDYKSKDVSKKNKALKKPNSSPFYRSLTGWEIPLGPFQPDQHTHFILKSSRGTLLYRDPRTFGKIMIFPKGASAFHPRLAKLGPDPLTLSTLKLYQYLCLKAGITPLLNPSSSQKTKQDKAYILPQLQRTSMRPVKMALLDQELITGVGNIYADESLFRAGIHPATAFTSLSGAQIHKLSKAIRSALKQGIKYSGTTFSDYRHPDGGKGQNQERLLVYGRASSPCPTCKKPLEKIVLGGRGTVFCSVCQNPKGK